MLQTGRSPFVKGSKYIYMHRIFSPSSGGVEAFEVTACHYIILLYESGWVPTGVHFVQKVGCSLCPRILFSDFRNSPNTPCEVGNCLLTTLSKGEVGRFSVLPFFYNPMKGESTLHSRQLYWPEKPPKKLDEKEKEEPYTAKVENMGTQKRDQGPQEW